MMGEALTRGLLRAGWDPSHIVLSDVRADRLESLQSELGVEVAADAAAAAGAASEGLILAVKPQDAAAVLRAVGPSTKSRTMMSIVAGLRTSSVREIVDGPCVRAMPNTPARVGKGVTALAAPEDVPEESRQLAAEVFSSVGPVLWVEERWMDVVTAVSGSGPAYVFLLAEAMIEAAVGLGLDPQSAATLVATTIEGAGSMLTGTMQEPKVLRDQVTSPKGTTAAALDVLAKRQFREAISEAVHAAARRSGELGA